MIGVRIWQCEWSYRRSVTRDCKRLRSPPISWQEVQYFPKVFQERPEARASHPRPQQKLYCAPWRLLAAGSCLLVREEWACLHLCLECDGGGPSRASYKYPLIDGEKKPACAAKLHNKAASVPKDENILQALSLQDQFWNQGPGVWPAHLPCEALRVAELDNELAWFGFKPLSHSWAFDFRYSRTT